MQASRRESGKSFCIPRWGPAIMRGRFQAGTEEWRTNSKPPVFLLRYYGLTASIRTHCLTLRQRFGHKELFTGRWEKHELVLSMCGILRWWRRKHWLAGNTPERPTIS